MQRIEAITSGRYGIQSRKPWRKERRIKMTARDRHRGGRPKRDEQEAR